MSTEPAAAPDRDHVPRTDPRPLHSDDRRTVLIGTAAWVGSGLALLPYAGQLIDSGRGWWFLTCATGVCLGLVGLDVIRRRDRRAGPTGRSGPPPVG